MTLDQEVESITYDLRADHLVAFAVLASLESTQRSSDIDPNKIAGLFSSAAKITFESSNVPVFNTYWFAIKYMPWGWESQDINAYLADLIDLGFAVKLGRYIVNSKGIDEFRRVVKSLYLERPDVATAYTKLVGSSSEKLFYS